MMKGLRNPKGSKILTVSLSTNRLLTGSDFPYLYNSAKLKNISSLAVSQLTPRTLTVFPSIEVGLLKLAMNELPVVEYPCYAQRTLGSPGGKHC